MNEPKNKIAKKLKLVLENLWLIVALLALIISVRETLNVGLKDSLIYYAFTLVASFFYFTRRNQRLKA